MKLVAKAEHLQIKNMEKQAGRLRKQVRACIQDLRQMKHYISSEHNPEELACLKEDLEFFNEQLSMQRFMYRTTMANWSDLVADAPKF